MPGYLTHAMVLIRMVEWLRELRRGLKDRRDAGKPLSALDERLDDLAHQTLVYLAEETSTQPETLRTLTRIANGVGNGISTYALVGSLGPDIATAGNILAINQEWASRQLHRGGPRRAYEKAKSTTLVLKLLELAEKFGLEQRTTGLRRRDTIAYALGHLSHIAADVLLHPAVHELADQGQLDPLKHREFEVALDARVAHGFFQREDLHEGDSWEQYYVNLDDHREPLTRLMGDLSEAFKATYGDVTPNAAVCALPDPTKCLAPTFEAEFLINGYRNTTKWALDAGYDHGPQGLNVLWTLAIVSTALLSALWLGIGTNSVWTFTGLISDANAGDIARKSGDAKDEWEHEGAENPDVWRDVVEEALNWSGRAFMPFAFILGGDLWMYPLTVWQAPDGVFGQGTQDPWKKDSERAIAAFGLPGKDVVLLVLGEIFVPLTVGREWKWFWAIADLGLELLDHFRWKSESRKYNQEGDRLGHALAGPKWIVAASHLLGNAATMVWKHARKQGEKYPAGIHGEDFVFPLIFSGLTAGIFVWWKGWFTDHVLEHTVGAPWPSADSSSVDSRLSIEVIGGKRKILPPTDRSLDFKVRLFPAATADPGGAHFPEDSNVLAHEFDAHASKDAKVRREALKPWDDEKYTLPELFEHAAQFAGLLGMAAVAYNEAAPPVRQHMTAIFKDWNLDFASVEQWKELMEVKSDGTLVGILPASQRYTLDLAAGVDTLDTQATEILREALGVTEVAGSISADFARTGEALNVLNRARAQSVRLTRPGAVLLANLDIEKVPAIASPLPSRVGMLDAQVDDKVNVEGDDKDELTHFLVRKPGTAGSPHEVVLRLNPADAARVRIFEVTAGPPDTWPPRLGATPAGVVEEFPLPAGDPAEVEFAIEAKWLTGDPATRPDTGPGPVSPLPFAPGGVASGAPTVPARRPNDVWLEVLHKEGGAIVPGIRDTAVFTIAPFLLIPNTQPVERLWIVYIPDSLTRERTTFIPALPGLPPPTDERPPGNHPTVADVHDALASEPALLARLNVTRRPAASGSLSEFEGHKPVPLGDAANAKLFYIIEGSNVADETDTIVDLGTTPPIKRRDRQTMPDQWVQDAFELGYTFAPQAHMHVAFQNPRTRLADGLGKFLDRELPAEDLGLFASLPVQTDAIDFGGNIECSLPVAVTTARIADGAAGLEILEQKAATHGKIIIGEGAPHLFDIPESFAPQLAGTPNAALVAEFKSHNCFLDAAASIKPLGPNLWRLTTAGAGQYELRRTGGHIAVHFYRGLMDAYRTFLTQQRVQPIVSFDTSWLDVGHVDEVMIMVPDVADPARRFRLVTASSQLAVDILREALTLHESNPALHPLTKMFRRKQWRGTPPEIAKVANAAQTVKKALERGRVFNEKIQTLRLTPIRDRLIAALDIDAAHVIDVPVLFDSVPDALMSHLGGVHWKPSAPPAGAEKVTIMRTSAYTPNQANMQVVNNHLLVPRPFGPRMKPADVVTVLSAAGVTGVALGDLAGLDQHDSWERRGTPLADIATAFGVSAAAIKSHPENASKFTGADTVKNNWERIRIPEGRVDLLEACTRTRLKATGATLHFIDTWNWYHRLNGDIHCGTNAQRTPMENDPAYPKWWDAEAMKGIAP